MKEWIKPAVVTLSLILFVGLLFKSNSSVGSSFYDDPRDVEYEDYTDVCEDTVYDWSSALEEANGTIDELNSMIEEAQSSSGATYEEMADALDSLETRDTTSGP